MKKADKELELENIKHTLKLYNTKTRKVEDFKPINSENVRVYSCGPTVYHYAHLGNLRAYVFADLLQRVLKTIYPNVTHVINITDVGHLVSDGDEGEDKLEKGSLREGKSVWDIAKFYTEEFMKDLDLLNIDTEDFIFPRATDFIKEQIKIVNTLTEKKYTYKTSDGIYFDTSLFPKYGDFAKLDIENLNAGERVELGEKKNKTDFALWKFSPKNESRQMEWIFDGKKSGTLLTNELRENLTDEEKETLGFPGWHIECSAMSESILGEHFDIHTGGIDHIPVHHTNEIAQSECAFGREFVNYWCHVNFLNDKTGKMSKSNGDFLRLETLVEKNYSPAAYRYLLLTTSYRSELAFSFESLDSAQNALNKLAKFMHIAAQDIKNIQDATNYKLNASYYENFLDKMYNDLNTSSALAIMWEMINDKAEYTYSTILAMNRILGLDLTYIEKEKTFEDLNDDQKLEVQNLIEQRKIARSNRDWATADTLRDEIKSFGIEVID